MILPIMAGPQEWRDLPYKWACRRVLGGVGRVFERLTHNWDSGVARPTAQRCAGSFSAQAGETLRPEENTHVNRLSRRDEEKVSLRIRIR